MQRKDSKGVGARIATSSSSDPNAPGSRQLSGRDSSLAPAVDLEERRSRASGTSTRCGAQEGKGRDRDWSGRWGCSRHLGSCIALSGGSMFGRYRCCWASAETNAVVRCCAPRARAGGGWQGLAPTSFLTLGREAGLLAGLAALADMRMGEGVRSDPSRRNAAHRRGGERRGKSQLVVDGDNERLDKC